MAGTLLIHAPGQPPREVELTKDSYLLGRSPQNEIVIDLPVVSRQHGQLKREGADWVYTNLSTTSGTRVDGALVQTVRLQDGTRLQLGADPEEAAILTFRLGTQTETVMAKQTRDSIAICLWCQSPLPPDSQICPSCGQPLPSAQSARSDGTMVVAAVPEPIVAETGGKGRSHLLSKPLMRVGRAPDNDIVISSELVSRYHLQLETHAGQVAITDLHSTNGTQINGVRIPANECFELHPGDVLRVGDLTGNSIQITYGSMAGGIRVQSTGMIDLTKLAAQPALLIGRSAVCDLSIPHPIVSNQHALITRVDGNVLIRDLASTNGTYVNGARINQAVLQNGDVIQIGPYRLVYDLGQQSLIGSRRLGHRLDALCLVRQVKGGFTILDNVSLSIHSSEFVALVGGSGAGKTTLLRALNGYQPATKGQLLIDGEDFYGRLDRYRAEMGYVPQDDIIHRELPVRLALWYAAKLRLPDASNAEIEKSIDSALSAVEMAEHQNKRVKDLSGGQRKRVSIASELLAQPTLFFLDEPTSGLDPGLEKKMMYDLKRLADQGRTIVLVTHATSNIEQCDYVAFMAKGGKLAYYGPPREAIKFFEAQDFADIYQKLSFEIDPAKGVEPPPELVAEYQDCVSTSPDLPVVSAKKKSTPGKISAGVLWASRFRRSPAYQKYITERQSRIQAGRQSDTAASAPPPRPRHVSFLQQSWILARRHFDLIRHDVRTLIILLAMIPLIGLLFALVSYPRDLVGGLETARGTIVTAQSDIDSALKDALKGKAVNANEKYTPYVNASTLLLMIGLALTQGGTFGASYEIVKERPIFQRERAVNLSVWSYVLSKVLVLSLFAVLQVVGFLLLLSTQVDLQVQGIIFKDWGALELFITLYLAVLASIGFGLFISAIVPSTDVVLYVILAELFVQIVLSGTLFPLPRNLASYATPGYWTMDALASTVDLPKMDKAARSCTVVEMEIPTETGTTKSKEIVCDSASTDEENLKNYGHFTNHLIIAWAALGIHLIGWVGLTIFIQSRKKPGKD